MHTCKCGGILFPRTTNTEKIIWDCLDCGRYEVVVSEKPIQQLFVLKETLPYAAAIV
jgi:hypothetical protein